MRAAVAGRTPGMPPRECFRTTSGRDVTVGRLALSGAGPAGQRITLDLGDCPGCRGSAWAGLTAAEARRLARALLAQAAAADRENAAPGQVTAAHAGGDTYAISTRGHVVLVDQPAAAGGRDSGMTPTELLAASLASCVAFYAGRYLLRHGMDRSGLEVRADFDMAERPARVGAVRLRLAIPGGVPQQRRDAMRAVASHCIVHNTLRQEPAVSIEFG